MDAFNPINVSFDYGIAQVYTQPCPEALKSGQASNKCHPDLTKPSTSLPTLPTSWALHLSIDDTQVGWLNSFLTNMDILNDVCLKHKQCGVSQDAPKVFLCLWGCPTKVYCHGVLPQECDMAPLHAHSHYLKLGVWCPWVGQDSSEKWACVISS